MEQTPGALLDGRYRLQTVVGRGGCADVWRALDERLDRAVAIKIVRMDATDDAVTRGAMEARLMASLSHPNLVAVLDSSVIAGPASGGVAADSYIVMEFVDGGTLAVLLAPGPLAAQRAFSLGSDIGAALTYLHSRGVIHRDIKPANVLFTGEGTAKLADFGIARVLGSEAVTRTGQVIGTAAYLSPEQVRGDRPTAASDVYSLGLVLLECLTGVRAYPGTPIESAMARLSRGPGIPPHLPDDLRSLLTAMTATDPLARPTASQLTGVLLGRTKTLGRVHPPVALGATAITAGLPETAPLTVRASERDTVALTALGRPALAPTALLPTAADDDAAPGGSHRRSRRYAWLGLPGAAAVVVAVLLAADPGSRQPAPTAAPTPSVSSGAAGVSTVLGATAPVSHATGVTAAATSHAPSTPDAAAPPHAGPSPVSTVTAPATAPTPSMPTLPTPTAPKTPPGKGKGKKARG